MKSKESPNLYEILKATTSPAGTPDTVQPRPVMFSVESPTPVRRVEVPPPAPIPARASAETPPARSGLLKLGPGDRVLRITQNTAIFLALAVVGLLFVAYAIGVRVGRGKEVTAMPEKPKAEEEANLESESILAPIEETIWTVRLTAWPGDSRSDREKALSNANIFKRALVQQGLPDAFDGLEVENGKKYWVLRYGQYRKRDAAEARRVLEKLQQFQLNGKRYFSQAGMEAFEPANRR